MQAQSDLTQQQQQQQQQQQKQNNKSATWFMLFSVALYSTVPIVFAIGNSNNSPFLFVALINFSAVISGLVFLVWFHRAKRKNQTLKQTIKAIYSKIYTKAFFWLSIDNFEFIFFALSLSYINVAIASILIAIQPIVIALITARLFKKHGRYHKITAEQWFLFVLSFIGVGFVVTSQSENFGAITGDLLNPSAIIGVLLIALSVFVGGTGTPYSLKLGVDASEKTGGGEDDELFFTIAFMFVVWVVGSVLFSIIGIATEENFTDINVYPAIAYGIFGQLFGLIFSRLAYLKTTNLTINALRYATPVISLVWLGLASLINIPHFDWLVIGASAIIIANILLNLKADTRRAYMLLVIILWLFSAVIYLFYGY